VTLWNITRPNRVRDVIRGIVCATESHKWTCNEEDDVEKKQLLRGLKTIYKDGDKE